MWENLYKKLQFQYFWKVHSAEPFLTGSTLNRTTCLQWFHTAPIVFRFVFAFTFLPMPWTVQKVAAHEHHCTYKRHPYIRCWSLSASVPPSQLSHCTTFIKLDPIRPEIFLFLDWWTPQQKMIDWREKEIKMFKLVTLISQLGWKFRLPFSNNS